MKTQIPTYRMGIDAGSKTIKVALLDADGTLVYSSYHRHRTDIRETLRQIIHDIIWLKGDMDVVFTITGSAGIGISELLNAPFVQEVVATTKAVQQLIPNADAVIELGGEDAKVIYLTDGVEQRMNATCAGGTGGFIDTIAFMLGIRTSDISTLAMGSSRTYPIASRCAVFAQTDVRPLLNEGVPKHDIAASALDAVVRQTLGGLACGRPIKGNVVFLGGPLEHIPDLVNRFRKALNLNRQTGIKPKDAHLYTAIGAALFADGKDSETIKLSYLMNLLDSKELEDNQLDNLDRLPPLFASEEDLSLFRKAHSKDTIPTGRLFDTEGPLYLGIDAGSTTVKLAVIDESGVLVHSDYRPSRGDTINTIREMLLALYTNIPKQMIAGKNIPYIAHATATGYGERMLIKGFGIDSGIVETAAHVRAARHICPDATFVLDIGGQDMKALWLSNGYVKDAVLNEACSSGCGAFIEGTAHALRLNPVSFANAALLAKNPVDLGTRCTVFMSSRVKHAQKAGASVEDIAAGVAYSVIQNALFRIIGKDRLNTLGKHVIVQGGTFKSDAVLRAFETICEVDAIRPDQAHLMGAIGAALAARDRASEISGIASEDALNKMSPKRSTKRCHGCQNNCLLSVLDFGNGNKIVAGNRCDRGAYGPVEKPTDKDDASTLHRQKDSENTPVDLIAREQELISELMGSTQRRNVNTPDRSSISIGLLNALELYRYTPFWHTLLTALGFRTILPKREIAQNTLAKAWETIPAEGVCYPAKLAHAYAYDLQLQSVDAIFFPAAERGNHCSVACEYPYALSDSIEWLRTGEIKNISPKLSSTKPVAISKNCADIEHLENAFSALCMDAKQPLKNGEMKKALMQALAAQEKFERTLADETEAALKQLESNPDAHAILLAGRPYHTDPAVLHNINRMLCDLGFYVFGITGLTHRFSSLSKLSNNASEWRPAKRLLKAAHFSVETPRMELVCLQSFGCGYDAMSLEEVRILLESHSRPFTALKIDEMVETAHIRIRLRTLAETVGIGSKLYDGMKRDHGKSLENSDNKAALSTEGSLTKSDISTPTNTPSQAAYLLAEPISDEDLSIARSSTVKDVCFSATVLAARAIRMLNDDPSICELSIPEACKDCLNEAIPRMVERATGLSPVFVWKHSIGVQNSASNWNTGAATTPRADRPKIGIIGNPLLVFEPYMNDKIISLIEKLGCTAVLPEENSLYVEDVRYLDQLQSFAEQGVKHVIYLQSFGCVKGHVFARGSHNLFRKRFPDMPVTVIDFDPEASALNRENRIRLIIESVLQEN